MSRDYHIIYICDVGKSKVDEVIYPESDYMVRAYSNVLYVVNRLNENEIEFLIPLDRFISCKLK